MSMFWITMRQYTAERRRQRRSSTIRDLAAPLHVSVSTAATRAMNQDSHEIKSKFMKDVGNLLKQFLTKFWIAIVAIMLFTSGITGSRMTVFRIIYMSLFLIFVITFQVMSNHCPYKAAAVVTSFFFLNSSSLISDILESLEKNDVSILVNSYWLLYYYADLGLHLSVSKLSDILGIHLY